MESNAANSHRALSPLLRWTLPSLSPWLWLVMLALLLTPRWETAMVSSDGDACMHWAVGEEMMRTGRIVGVDTFSHTNPGAPVISKEWLAEILYALAGRLGSFHGLATLAAVVIATTFALLHRQLLRAGADLITASLFTLLAAWAASIHFLARPHVFSFLLLFFWNAALRRCRGHRLALVLGLMAVLWVNLHGGFLAGFLVLGAYWLGALWDRDRARLRQLTVAGLVAAAASLANPSGWRLHLHNIAFLRSPLTGSLAEYASCTFDNFSELGFLVWLGLLFLVLAVGRPRLNAADTLLLLSWSYFALYAARNVPLLVIVSAPILTPPASALARRLWGARAERLQQTDEAMRGGWLVAALAAVYVVWMPHPVTMPAERWPVDAVKHIRAHPGEFDGRMFNQYAWGGYLMHILPEHKTFVDGRADFYSQDVIRDFGDVTDLAPRWREILDRREVSWTLMPTEHRLNLALALSPGWQREYADATATIWHKLP